MLMEVQLTVYLNDDVVIAVHDDHDENVCRVIEERLLMTVEYVLRSMISLIKLDYFVIYDLMVMIIDHALCRITFQEKKKLEKKV